MAKTTVNLTVSQLIRDLGNGMTWLSSEDEGYGSIEATYGAKPHHIEQIRTHPKLAGLEPTITIFTVTDDTKGDSVQPAALKSAEPAKPVDISKTFVKENPKETDFSNLL